MKRASAVRAIGLVVVVLVGTWYVRAHWEDFQLLGSVGAGYVLVLIASNILAMEINGRILRDLCGCLGIRLSHGEAFGLTAMHSFANYLPVPQAGSLARGVYLKKVHGLEYSGFGAVLAVTYIRFLWVVGFLGLVSSVFLSIDGITVGLPLWVVFLALLAAPTALRSSVWGLPGLRRLQALRAGLEELQGFSTVLRLSLYQAGLLVVTGGGLWIAFAALGRPISLLAGLMLALVSMASGVINVTPGNLGIAEASAWITARLIEVDPGETVVAYVLFRAAAAITILGLAPFFMGRLRRRAAIPEA